MEDNIILYGILSLATWRISHMLIYEDGPFDIFERVRRLGLPISVNPNSVKYFIYRLFSCVYCMSVWVSIGLCALVLGIDAWYDVVVIFAMSALAIFYEEIFNGES